MQRVTLTLLIVLATSATPAAEPEQPTVRVAGIVLKWIRTDKEANFLICPSGGMFGPKTNDPIVRARSRENRIHIIFVHPAEFLVTGPDGSILQRTILGDRLLIAPEEADGETDRNRVFYFDLPPALTQPTETQ